MTSPEVVAKYQNSCYQTIQSMAEDQFQLLNVISKLHMLHTLLLDYTPAGIEFFSKVFKFLINRYSNNLDPYRRY